MTLHTRQLAVLFCPVLLLAACGSSGQHRTARLLDQRLQAGLAPDIAAGRATLQPLPDGARVTLLDPASFSNSADALDNRQNDVRASLIEALLDPSLMRLQVTDTSTLPDYQRQERVQNVMQYFQANALALSLQPAEPLPPSTEPQGVAVTINVQCPDRSGEWGYGSGRARPECR